MAKYGSRAITSVCGTIDILEAVGVDVSCDPDTVKRSIEQAGIGIFNGMSPKVHPQALGRILSQIAFGTTMYIAASLELVQPVAQIMKEIGYKKAIAVKLVV